MCGNRSVASFDNSSYSNDSIHMVQSDTVWRAIHRGGGGGGGPLTVGALPQNPEGAAPPRPPRNGAGGGPKAGFGAEPQLPAYMIQSSLQVWSTATRQICLNPVSRGAVRARVASPNGPRLSVTEARTAVHRAKLDSDKFGDQGRDQNRWLD